jgi:hypothetical protein
VSFGVFVRRLQPGDIRYVDVNGDNVIDAKDRTNLEIRFKSDGFNLQMNYKNLDLAFTFASVGNDMVRNYERTLSDANRLNYVLIDGQAKEQVI